MAYTAYNFKTKKHLKEVVKSGHGVHIFQPGGMFPLTLSTDSKGRTVAYLEGPHYPSPHTWYATAEIDPTTNEIIKIIN